MEITKNEVAEWRSHPVTAKIFQYLKDNREDLKEELAQSVLGEHTALLTASAVGSCRILQAICEVSYEDIVTFYNIEIKEEENDDTE